jgi:hypothetical protein
VTSEPLISKAIHESRESGALAIGGWGPILGGSFCYHWEKGYFFSRVPQGRRFQCLFTGMVEGVLKVPGLGRCQGQAAGG